jgi:molybdenum cofactor synthesis domain-containing protein
VEEFLRQLPTALLLAIGDELLNGDVRDVNIYRMSRWLTRLGIWVEEARLIRDTPAEIKMTLQSLLAKAPEVLIISGGLGPTEDDRTLAAVADAVNVALTAHPEARRLVEAQYERLLDAGHVAQRGSANIRRKMAQVPAGATPLPNPRGTAPGVVLTHESTRIYCLPGVPAELEAIFTEAVVHDIHAHLELGAWVEFEMTVACQDEAAVAAPLREVAPRHPNVYLKSLARAFPAALDGRLRIIASAHAPSEVSARERADAALRDLQQHLEALDFSVSGISSHEPEGDIS